jgi:small subunit ribosomal protein S1
LFDFRVYSRGLALTLTDSDYPAGSIEGTESQIENQPNTSSPSEDAAESTEATGRRILIGSQRDPAAYRARPKRDWTPVEEGEQQKTKKGEGSKNEERGMRNEEVRAAEEQEADRNATELQIQNLKSEISNPQSLIPNPPLSFPPPRPSIRHRDLDLEDELSQALGDASMDDLLGVGAKTEEAAFEPDSLQSGRVVAVRRDDVFVEFAGREQGILSVRLFDVPPRVGAEVQVVVQRLNPEDGLYELSLPNKAVQVDDWSDLVEGMMIEVRVTGHNTGGLECEVNHIRGFIPISQISMYRIEDLAPYVDQRLACIITEANPDRRNLVLSHRAVLEREKEQARELMLSSLQPGQIFDGVASNIPATFSRKVRRSRCASRRSIPRPARSVWRIATCWIAPGPRPPKNIRPKASSKARSPS